MSMGELQTELMKFLNTGKTDQEVIIDRLKRFYEDYGTKTIHKWHNTANKNNSLLHEFVERKMIDVVRHLILDRKFDINVRRDPDGITPLQLSLKNGSTDISYLLKELGANDIQMENVAEWEFDNDKRNSLNIVWMDLEMTSIEEPEILECAVIITDKDLNELERANWVIHFDQTTLSKLGNWHQKTFADISEEGNGLFTDVIKSKLTKQQVEEELLTLIKRYCPPETCPLAGSSIHTDKMVLKKCMPNVDKYLHYRIIDVTSFRSIMKRWVPELVIKIEKQMKRTANSDQEMTAHRAMDDIKQSLEFMKQLRRTFDKLKNNDQHWHEGSVHHARGASNNFSRGASNHFSPNIPPRHQRAASSHGNRRSIVQEDHEVNHDLPTISPDAENMELHADERRLIERIEQERRFSVSFLQLPNKSLQIYNNNPHLREVFMNRHQIQKYDKDFNKENRLLTFPVRSTNESINSASKSYSTTEHWGQRKLLLTEIEFLTKYASDNQYTIVYAGAASGTYFNFLAGLFPDLNFVLIDEANLSVKQSKNIQVRKEKFTQGIARQYSNSTQKIIFICSIRTYRGQPSTTNDPKEDMENQLEWYKIMKPHVALLNFRLPRSPGMTLYLSGYQIIEPWGSKRPSECRLVVKKDAKMTNYYHQDFEDDLFRFQSITRVMYYEHNMDDMDTEGLDHCYDCRAEIYILQKYLTDVQRVKTSDLKNATANLSRNISSEIRDPNRPRFLNVPRTLAVIPKRSAMISTNI